MMTIIAICVATIMNSDWADSGEGPTTCAHAPLNGPQTAAECHDDDDYHDDDYYDDDDDHENLHHDDACSNF